MWNIKMRASKKASRSRNVTLAEFHISGAEGIVGGSEIARANEALIKRALTHPRGAPDKIVITLEKISGTPLKSAVLPVETAASVSPDASRALISAKAAQLGISAPALTTAFRVLYSRNAMRGASIISSLSGKRLEPDKKRGVRVSCFGIDKTDDAALSERLRSLGLNNTTVKEALLLASKVASCRDITAEICVSDDPDYTTGYIASRRFGYLRILNIKKPGSMCGGRVFFVREGADTENVISYLQNKPVILQYGSKGSGRCGTRRKSLL
jgi:6-carboxyhexanoate--CoA ligase